MKFILGIFLLITLSSELQTESKDFSIPFESQNTFQYYSYKMGIGSTENNFLVSLYYPCIIYDKSQGDYEPTGESSKKVSITPLFSSEAKEFNVYTDTFKANEVSSTKDMSNVDFLLADTGIGKEKIPGYFGLAPLASSPDLKDLLTLDLLKNKGIIANTLFSIGNIQKQTDGSYKGVLTLGKKHADFQTTKGKSSTCTDKSDYFWGCDFKKLSYGNKNLPFDSQSKVILINEEVYAFFDYDKYFTAFKELLPTDGGCTGENDGDYYYYKCDSWSIDEMNIKLNYKLIDEYNLVLSVPDENDLFGKNKKHFEFYPAIKFVKNLKDVLIPMIWFKNYHVLFSKEQNSKSSLVFHVNDEKLIETVGEVKKDDSDYIKLSTTAFVFLCISAGIVLIFLVMVIGYVRMSNKKSVRGIQTKGGIKGTNPGKIPTFDSSLLGTSNDSMPKRMKTSI